jgi:hypothetical protein
MENWIDRLAERLDEEPLTADEVTALLDLAHDVAHSFDPEVTALSMFLVGTAVGRRVQWVEEDIEKTPEAVYLLERKKTIRRECIEAQGGWLRDVLPEAPPDA